MGQKESTDSEETKKSNPWGDSLSSALADSRKAGLGSKARARAGREATEKSGAGEHLSDEGRKKLAKVFAPEAWKAICKIPFTLGETITGRECWRAGETQIDTLAVSSSATAEYFLSVEPKWAVAFMCATNWAIILSEKFILNARERAKELELNPPAELAPITMNGSTSYKSPKVPPDLQEVR